MAFILQHYFHFFIISHLIMQKGTGESDNAHIIILACVSMVKAEGWSEVDKSVGLRNGVLLE